MSKEYLSWSEIKAKNGVWSYDEEDANEYQIYKDDGKIRYFTTLEKSEYQTPGHDTKDFYDYIKPEIDANPEAIQPRSMGNPNIFPTYKSLNKQVYLTGSGDNLATSEIGKGTLFEVSMLSSDTSPKSITLEFTQEVSLKDAVIFFENAPKGAKVCICIVDASDIPIESFGHNLLLRGSNYVGTYLNTESLKDIPLNHKIKITVENGSTPTDFDVWGWLEMIRENTT